MPISENESGLLTADFNLLQERQEEAVWNLTAHRYNLEFDKLSPYHELDTDVSNTDWDSCTTSDDAYVAHLVGGKIYFYSTDPEDVSEKDPYEIPGFVRTPLVRRSSIVSEDDELFVFTASGRQIVRYRIDYDGESVLSTEYIDPELDIQDLDVNDEYESIAFVAATSKTQCHFVIYNSNTRIYHLRCAVYADSAWSIHHSRIWYTYQIQSFDAVATSTRDVIVMSAQTPGNVAVETDLSGNVINRVEPAGGILSFTYKDNWWSDHTAIDVLDNISSHSRMRSNVRVSNLNGVLFATSFSINGTVEYPFAAYRIYTSKDGIHWSFGRITPFAVNPNRYGIKMQALDDFIYCVDAKSVYRSDSTLFSGHSSPAVQMDISEYVTSLSMEWNQQTSVSFDILKGDGYEDNDIITMDNIVAFELRTGYKDEDGDSVLVDNAIVIADTIEDAEEAPDKQVSVSCRDIASYMLSSTQAEESKYWEANVIGPDNYTDNTETGYGGLRHTATQYGTWETEDNILQISDKNKEALAFSTYSIDIWNGSHQVEFKLSLVGKSEYAGIVYRAVDKDNLWHATYKSGADRIRLYQRIAGEDTQVAQSGLMNWDTVNTWRHMMVKFYYGHVRVYSSEDGVTWEEQIEYFVEGQGQAGTTSSLLSIEKGYVGQIGYGYAPQKQYVEPDFEFPSFSWDIPDIDITDFNVPFPTIQPLPDYPVLYTTGSIDVNPLGDGSVGDILGVWDSTRIAITEDFSEDTPTWQSISLPGGVGRVWDMKITPGSTVDDVTVYILVRNGAQYELSLFRGTDATGSVSWENLGDFDIPNTQEIKSAAFDFSLENIGVGIEGNYGTTFWWSIDDGDSYDSEDFSNRWQEGSTDTNPAGIGDGDLTRKFQVIYSDTDQAFFVTCARTDDSQSTDPVVYEIVRVTVQQFPIYEDWSSGPVNEWVVIGGVYSPGVGYSYIDDYIDSPYDPSLSRHVLMRYRFARPTRITSVSVIWEANNGGNSAFDGWVWDSDNDSEWTGMWILLDGEIVARNNFRAFVENIPLLKQWTGERKVQEIEICVRMTRGGFTWGGGMPSTSYCEFHEATIEAPEYGIIELNPLPTDEDRWERYNITSLAEITNYQFIDRPQIAVSSEGELLVWDKRQHDENYSPYWLNKVFTDPEDTEFATASITSEENWYYGSDVQTRDHAFGMTGANIEGDSFVQDEAAKYVFTRLDGSQSWNDKIFKLAIEFNHTYPVAYTVDDDHQFLFDVAGGWVGQLPDSSGGSAQLNVDVNLDMTIRSWVADNLYAENRVSGTTSSFWPHVWYTDDTFDSFYGSAVQAWNSQSEDVLVNDTGWAYPKLLNAVLTINSASAAYDAEYIDLGFYSLDAHAPERNNLWKIGFTGEWEEIPVETGAKRFADAETFTGRANHGYVAKAAEEYFGGIFAVLYSADAEDWNLQAVIDSDRDVGAAYYTPVVYGLTYLSRMTSEGIQDKRNNLNSLWGAYTILGIHAP